MIHKLSQQAMDLNLRLMVETHCSPDEAGAIRISRLPQLLQGSANNLIIRDTIQSTEDLSVLRDQIDDLDNELFSFWQSV